MREFLRDLWGFMRVRKKFWMIPVVLVLIAMGFLIVLGQGSVAVPFIYALF